MKFKILALGLLVTFASFSCGGDDEEEKKNAGAIAINCETFFTTDYLPLLEDLQDAAEAYAEDQSVENCQTYYDATVVYIESWKEFVEKCYPDLLDTYESYWSTWEDYQDDLTCGS